MRIPPQAGSRLSMLCLCHGSQFDAYPILAEFCLLRCDVNPVQTRSIFAENLALDLQGQIDAILFFDVIGNSNAINFSISHLGDQMA